MRNSARDKHKSTHASQAVLEPIDSRPPVEDARVRQLEQQLAKAKEEAELLQQELIAQQAAWAEEMAALQRESLNERRQFQLERTKIAQQRRQSESHGPTGEAGSIEPIAHRSDVAFQTLESASLNSTNLPENKADIRVEFSPEAAASGTDAASTENGPPEGHEDEDASIEQYMNALLQRVGGRAGETGSDAVNAAISNDPPHYDTARVAKSQAAAGQPRQAADSPIRPRAVGPEETTKRLAMRELANFSTQVALNRHNKRQVTMSAVITAGLAIVAFMASIAINNWDIPLGNYASGAALVLGVVFTIRLLFVVRRLRRMRKSMEIRLTPEEAAERDLGNSVDSASEAAETPPDAASTASPAST